MVDSVSVMMMQAHKTIPLKKMSDQENPSPSYVLLPTKYFKINVHPNHLEFL